MLIFRFSPISKSYGKIAITVSDQSGLERDENGNITVKYILSDNANLLGNIDWNNNPSVKFSIATGSGFEIIPDGSYPHYIYCYVKDIKGNYAESREYYSATDLCVVPQVDVQEGSFKTSIECPSNYSYNMKFSYSYLDNTEWKNNSTYTASKSGSVYTHSQTLTDAKKKSFVKIQPWNATYTGSPSAWYGRTLYVYAGYYYEDITCDLKDIVSGSSGINIFADQPCFAHIMYSTRNLGNMAETWLDEGLETAPVMKQKSFTYSYTNAEKVPSGCYYTTVVHFADGTYVMSGVKQKQ